MRRRAIAATAGLAGVLLALVIAARVVPLPEDFFSEPSTVVELSDGSWAHVFLSPDEKWRIQVDLDEVDPAYVDALIRLEDKRFWAHLGVDPIAIVRAAVLNVVRGRVVSGGSTLTMQLVRVREVRPRSLGSKIVEAFRALQLEVRYSKEEILEAYLQYVPYGRNVEGIEAAALAYFGHRATSLSPAEIATLLAVPQQPTKRFPTPKNVEALRRARDDLAVRLAEWDVLSRRTGQGMAPASVASDVVAQVRASDVPSELRPFPRFAAHAATWLRARHPKKTRLVTTLDRGLQLFAERTLADAAGELRLAGIQNGAIVVVDHQTSQVRALVGSFDFWDEAHGGQIIGFDNPRSPGSALKPFLYAMGIDRGLLLPDFLVLDTPKTFGTYSPKNYDGTYSGLVRFEDALSRSLNVPFVNLVRRIGVDKFIGTLHLLGCDSLSGKPGYYGLSSAIGGIELTPLELAGLYATLAEGGRYRPLVWLADVDATETSTVGDRGLAAFSPGAAHLTRRALSLKDRPDFPERRRMTGAPAHVHWKTGTSFGHRDAWAAGSGPRYTAVIWLGNFDNSPSVSLVGADAAGPILFDILDAAGRKGESLDEHPTPDLVRVEICAYSGRLPGPACEDTKWVWAIAKNVPVERCPYHVALDVDVDTGLALTPACRAGRNYRTENFLVWPSSLRRWLDDQHRRAPEPPSFAPGCEARVGKGGPSIVSPPPNHVALLIPGLPADKQEIPLAAEAPAGSGHLSWFVDGEYLGTTRPEDRMWWTPVPGAHEIVVTDDTGKSARRKLEVRTRL
ncbi:penicillin-binding protein 1C [Myxococcota bacterium]|nr:penicillin-binding protein 1C [Myxococcota bacterium]